MNAALRSTVTLAVLGLLLLLAAVIGWRAATAPFPTSEDQPLCEDRTVSAGTEVFASQVAVSVYNGSSRSGLASATMEQLVERGFVEADSGNAPRQVKRVQIWSDEPDNVAVQLVKRQFKGAKVRSGEELGRGVVVVVGSAFSKLRDTSVDSLTADADSTFCSPPGS